MTKITIKELQSLTANDTGRILREDGNLAGRISVRKDGVSVSFFYRYRWGEQNKEYGCEFWTRKSLTDIRKARNQARMLIDEQINPNEQKKTAKAKAYAAGRRQLGRHRSSPKPFVGRLSGGAPLHASRLCRREETRLKPAGR